ncbi:hypothetical protein EC844_12918 [Acinetobacter calcoaceticus]|uniref:Uncharacterized protein n=1 Tax=Acinetobacter calcoaceticus TaxID=471 RepID=A0A4R1XHZ2_ACICA|nr:hypothetical protein EC844_12918 [Acinetobacter calcoaceticus]
MENSKIDVYFDKTQSINDIYLIFDLLTKNNNVKLFCIDVDTFNWLPNEIYNFSEIKGCQYILIYISDDGFPCFTIDECIFNNETFFNLFLNSLNGMKYYLINDDVDEYELVQYDLDGLTGNIIKID